MACKTKRIKRMPIGGIISGVQSLRETGKAYKTDVEATDGQGNLVNRQKTENTFVAGTLMDPLAVLQEKNLTPADKAANLLMPGIAGNITKKRYANRIEQGAKKQLGMQKRLNGENLYQNNAINGTPLMPMGGMVPGNQETVELEKGEPFQTPDGQINMISNQAPTHAQGGVPITLPSGTKVLGKKPATDEKTFKQLGAKLERQQAKYNKILKDKPSRIEEQTASRMLAKINNQFNDLFELQGEDTQANQQFPEGGLVGTGKQRLEETFGMSAEEIRRAKEGDILSQQALRDPNTGKTIAYERYFKGIAGPQYIPVETDINKPQENLKIDTTYAYGGLIRQGAYGIKAGFGADNNYSFGLNDPYDYSSQYAPQLNDYASQVQYNPRIGGKTTYAPYDVSQSNVQSQGTQGSGFNVGNTLGTIGALAPVAYNLYQGMKKPDEVATNAFNNPYENEIRSTMRNRRYNAQPELEQARLGEATYARQLREGAPSQAQYLGGLQAGAISTQRNIGQILARKQNVDNEYLGQQAQTDMALGQAQSQNKRYIEDVNARSKAATKQFTATGLNQLGQFAQVKQQENNQMIRDVQRLNLLPALVQNFQLNENGEWVFKQTGEVVDNATVMNYVKGSNIK